MLGEDATTLLKSLIPDSGNEAAKAAVAKWAADNYSKVLLELITTVDLKLLAANLPTKGDDKRFVLWVYVVGTLFWALIWAFLAFIEWGTHANLGLFGSRGNLAVFLVFLLPPIGVGVLALGSNIIFLRRGSAEYSGFEGEVKAIDFLERHASFFLVGSSAVFFYASFSFRDLGLRFSFPAFVIYETLSLICLSTVLLLYWFPRRGDAKSLARVRHVKTIPFTFAVSFFLAALMIITTAALPVVVP